MGRPLTVTARAATLAAVIALVIAQAACSGGGRDPDGRATLCAAGQPFCSDATTVSVCNAVGTSFDPADDTTCAHGCQNGQCIAPDGDEDGIPDDADRCPADPEPTCATLGQLRTGGVAAGTDVTVGGVVVTAIASASVSKHAIWVQVPGATEFGGIQVWFGARALPTVAVGNTVTVRGKYTEYFGASQLWEPSAAPTVAVTSTSSSPPEPILVADPSRISSVGDLAEPLEGMLVKVQDATVTGVDAANDEFQVAASLWVNDLILDGNVNNGLPYAQGATFASITGILDSVSGPKLEPRTAADLVP